MARMFEVLRTDPIVEEFFRVLVNNNIIRRVEASPTITERQVSAPAVLAAPYDATPQPADPYSVFAKTENKYLNTHLPVESVIETIAKDIIGYCDARKDWLKDLKQAVKDYGHDEIINSFASWCEAQTPLSIRKPVTVFLKNVAQNVSVVTRSLVTNPALTRIEVRVAEISDNKVFFSGSYRLQLAAMIKDYGEPLVIKAFQEFYQTFSEEKNQQWAAKEFLGRGPVLIAAIIRKEQQKQQTDALLQEAYRSAKNDITVPDDNEEEL